MSDDILTLSQVREWLASSRGADCADAECFASTFRDGLPAWARPTWDEWLKQSTHLLEFYTFRKVTRGSAVRALAESFTERRKAGRLERVFVQNG